MEKTYYTSTTQVSDEGLLTRWLTDEEGARVCKAEFMHDGKGNVIVIQLDTPEFCRGRGFARKLLSEMRKRETKGFLRVIANEHARPYYEKLGYIEVAPNVYEAN